MIIPNAKRNSEIQRLRTLADLLELIGGIDEDDSMTKADINESLYNIILKNHLYEPHNIYSEELLEQLLVESVESNGQVGNAYLKLVQSTLNDSATVHKISEFYDITLLMVIGDKENSGPQIFSMYNEQLAIFDLENVCLEGGTFPKIGTQFVIEWILRYQNELVKMWDTGEIVQIPPLA